MTSASSPLGVGSGHSQGQRRGQSALPPPCDCRKGLLCHGPQGQAPPVCSLETWTERGSVRGQQGWPGMTPLRPTAPGAPQGLEPSPDWALDAGRPVAPSGHPQSPRAALFWAEEVGAGLLASPSSSVIPAPARDPVHERPTLSVYLQTGRRELPPIGGPERSRDSSHHRPGEGVGGRWRSLGPWHC